MNYLQLHHFEIFTFTKYYTGLESFKITGNDAI